MQLSNEETATEKILIFTEIYFGEISIFLSLFGKILIFTEIYFGEISIFMSLFP